MRLRDADVMTQQDCVERRNVMANPIFIFIVTGRGKDKANNATFSPMAIARTQEYLTLFSGQQKASTPLLPPPATAVFIWFNFDATTVSTYSYDVTSNSSAKNTTPTFQQLAPNSSAAATDPASFVDQKTHTYVDDTGIYEWFSIINLYNSVKQAPAGSVLSVEFFSHGFFEGPILTGTSARAQYASADPPQRDPNDFDGRGTVDFQSNGTMGGSDSGALKAFANAFVSSNASLRVYGCNIQDKIYDPSLPINQNTGFPAPYFLKSTARQVAEAAYETPLATGDPNATYLRRGKAPSSPVNLNMGDEFKEEICESTPGCKFYIPPDLNDYFYGADSSGNRVVPDAALLQRLHYNFVDTTFFNAADGLQIRRSYAQIIAFLARQIQKSYVFLAAQALNGITVYGPAPGSSGEMDSPAKGTSRLMKCSPKWIVQFYKLFLNIPYVETGALQRRYYGIFSTQVVSNINSLASSA